MKRATVKKGGLFYINLNREATRYRKVAVEIKKRLCLETASDMKRGPAL